MASSRTTKLRKRSADGTWIGASFMIAEASEIRAVRGSSYHFNSGNCLNTVRTPSLHPLLSVVKYASP